MVKGKYKKELPKGMAMEILERRGTELFVRTEKRKELMMEIRKHRGRFHWHFLKEIGCETVGRFVVVFRIPGGVFRTQVAIVHGCEELQKVLKKCDSFHPPIEYFVVDTENFTQM